MEIRNCQYTRRSGDSSARICIRDRTFGRRAFAQSQYRAQKNARRRPARRSRKSRKQRAGRFLGKGAAGIKAKKTELFFRLLAKIALRNTTRLPKISQATRGEIFGKRSRRHKSKEDGTFFPSSCKNCLAATWSRRRDLNSRPLGPEPSALPSCATPRLQRILYQTPAPFASVFPLLFQKDKADRIFAVRPLALFRSSLRLQDTSEWYRTPSEGLLP